MDPRQIQRAPGRPKSDTQDAQWIFGCLHSLGLLSGALPNPTEGIRVLRSYLRQRAGLVHRVWPDHPAHAEGPGADQRQTDRGRLRHHVGKTGLSIIQAILAGERDPTRLGAARDRRCQQDAEQIVRRALQGTWREEHLFEVEAGGRALGVLPPTNQRL